MLIAGEESLFLFFLGKYSLKIEDICFPKCFNTQANAHTFTHK